MRRFRVAMGISQEALSVRMGVDRAYISSMERGRQNVTLSTIFQVAQALGVRPVELLDELTAEDVPSLQVKVPRRPRTKPSG